MHKIRVYPSKELLAKEDQFAWKLAAMATDDSPVDSGARDMVINRMIDNASVAVASVNRSPVSNARSQALGHPRAGGATRRHLRCIENCRIEHRNQSYNRKQ